MNDKSQRQFSLGYAFALTAVVAIGVSSFLSYQSQIGTYIAIGFSIWVGVMGLLAAQVLFRVSERPVWRTLGGIALVALGILQICYPNSVLPDYDLRARSFANNKVINERFESIVASIDDPKAVLTASRELHEVLMQLPESE